MVKHYLPIKLEKKGAPLHTAVKNESGGTCVVQLVKRPTPNLGSGYDLRVSHEIEPHIKLYAGFVEPA